MKKIKLDSNISIPEELNSVIGGFTYKGYQCYVAHHVIYLGNPKVSEWYCGYMKTDGCLTYDEEQSVECYGGITYDSNPYIGFDTNHGSLIKFTTDDVIEMVTEMVDSYLEIKNSGRK